MFISKNELVPLNEPLPEETRNLKKVALEEIKMKARDDKKFPLLFWQVAHLISYLLDFRFFYKSKPHYIQVVLENALVSEKVETEHFTIFSSTFIHLL
ncbi:hypothetical protein JCM9492_00090 [Aquifex pyrophilus]